MPRIPLDLNDAEDRQKVNGEWRVGTGLVPGEPNEGLTAQLLASPARLADYDDSDWKVCANIRESLSVGFTFAWYRITVELPQQVNGAPVEGKAAAVSLLARGSHRIEHIQVTDLRIDGSGTTAYKTGRFETRYSAPGIREPQIVCGTHLWVLRKNSSGWKVAVVTWQLES